MRAGDCGLPGRFSVVRGYLKDAARRIVAGDPILRARQWTIWNANKVVKCVAGRPDLWFRDIYFRIRMIR